MPKKNLFETGGAESAAQRPGEITERKRRLRAVTAAVVFLCLGTSALGARGGSTAKVDFVPPPSPLGSDPVGVIRDGSAILAIPDVPKPSYLSWIQPASFRTRVTRIVGSPGDPIPTGGKWNADARHHYSNDQPWNADQTLIAIDQPVGSPDLLFLDGTTYHPRFGRCPAYHRQDDRWHPTMPHIRINAGGPLLEWFDVVRCVQVAKWTLPFGVHYLGLTNGNVSRDGRFIALGDADRMFVVDMVGKRIGPVAGIAYGGWTPTGLGVSPSGRYAWVHYRGDENRVFDINPMTLALTPRPMPGAFVCHGSPADGFIYDLGHQDVALNPFDDDEDVMAGQEHCGNVGRVITGQVLGHIVMVRLRDGKITSLTDPTNEAYAYHISCQNYQRLGWIYVSYFQNQAGKRFNQEIISVKMDGSKSVERWAHHHDDDKGCYRCEVHPVPSPDGLRVLFNSVWNINCNGGCGTLTGRQAYVVDGRPTH